MIAAGEQQELKTPDASGNKNFKVIGPRIFAPEGREFIAKGINVQGYNWCWPRDITQDAEKIADWWKFNLIRVVCNLFPHQNPKWKQFPDNNDLDKIVAVFTKRKIVVLIVPCYFRDTGHATGGYLEGEKLETLVMWHKRLADKHRHNPYVWFDVINEPGGHEMPDREKWINEHQAVIGTIRDEAGTENIIVCEGTFYGMDARNHDSSLVPTKESAILQWGKNLIAFGGKKYENIVFSIHAYDPWNYGDEKLADYIDRIHKLGFSLIVGEYSPKCVGRNVLPAMMSVFNVCAPKKVGRIAWHWFPGDKNYLTVYDEDAKQFGSGWEVNDRDHPTNLSAFGKKIWEDTHRKENLGSPNGYSDEL